MSAQISIDLKNWKMKDFVSFFKAGQNSDFDAIFELVSRVVTEWPFEGDPTQASAYGELSFQEWSEVQQALNKSVVTVLQGQGN